MEAQPVADFELPGSGGIPFRPADHLGRKLVLYFYPKDDTPGCTLEGREFAALHAQFQALDCDLFGISRDGPASHARFKAKLNLPFELLSDTDERVCELFAVMKLKNLYGKQVRGIERSTFVLDRAGQIAKAWRGVKIPGHAAAVLECVRSLP